MISNLRKFGGEEGNREADEIVKKVIARAAEGVKANVWKVKRFMKPDGSSSYTPPYPAITSQGALVCIPETYEGDVNATCINVLGTIHRMYQAAELEEFMVPLFDDDDWEFFLECLDKAKEKYYAK